MVVPDPVAFEILRRYSNPRNPSPKVIQRKRYRRSSIAAAER